MRTVSCNRRYRMPKKLAKGKVYKTILFANEEAKSGQMTEAALLELHPGSEVLRREYSGERVTYVIPNAEYETKCKVGTRNSLINIGDAVVQVLVLRHKR